MINPHDIPYLAGMILQINFHEYNPEDQSFCDFAKAMILITLGLESDPNDLEEFTLLHLPCYEQFLNDFRENFTTLYPQYFNDLHPVFQNVVDTITRENYAYYCDC